MNKVSKGYEYKKADGLNVSGINMQLNDVRDILDNTVIINIRENVNVLGYVGSRT